MRRVIVAWHVPHRFRSPGARRQRTPGDRFLGGSFAWLFSFPTAARRRAVMPNLERASCSLSHLRSQRETLVLKQAETAWVDPKRGRQLVLPHTPTNPKQLQVKTRHARPPQTTNRCNATSVARTEGGSTCRLIGLLFRRVSAEKILLSTRRPLSGQTAIPPNRSPLAQRSVCRRRSTVAPRAPLQRGAWTAPRVGV